MTIKINIVNQWALRDVLCLPCLNGVYTRLFGFIYGFMLKRIIWACLICYSMALVSLGLVRNQPVALVEWVNQCYCLLILMLLRIRRDCFDVWLQWLRLAISNVYFIICFKKCLLIPAFVRSIYFWFESCNIT